MQAPGFIGAKMNLKLLNLSCLIAYAIPSFCLGTVHAFQQAPIGSYGVVQNGDNAFLEREAFIDNIVANMTVPELGKIVFNA